MKQIKLSAVNHPNFNKVLVTVHTQTHLGTQFGGNVLGDSRKFRASNGIILGSNSHPARDDRDQNIIWVKGNGPRDKQSNCFVVTKEKYAKLVAAVKEYNEYFSDAAIYARQMAARPVYAAPAPARKADPCVTIIG